MNLRIVMAAAMLWLVFNVPIKAQQTTDAEVEHALYQAGDNRASLETLLQGYARDKEKLAAARYLIANMVWHKVSGRVISHDHRMDSIRDRADSVYYALVAGRPDTAINNPRFNKKLSAVDRPFRKRSEALHLAEPEVEVGERTDIEVVDGTFLRRQIEHAFRLRREVPRVKALSREDFFRFILPYRSVTDYPLVEPSDTYYPYYAKYLRVADGDSLATIGRRYNLTTRRKRFFGGNYPLTSLTGFPELFYLGMSDCVPLANYCALALRACGVPTTTEFAIGYKVLNGFHMHVAMKDTDGRWLTFNPESSQPRHRDPKFREALNLYRINFERNTESPYFLRADGEPLPKELSHPCLEDVTQQSLETIKLELPCSLQTANRLAYLAAFNAQDGGLRPVTWGVRDSKRKTIRFEHVVPDNLYFPVYYNEDEELVAFGDPFVLVADGEGKWHTERPTQTECKPVQAMLRSKFPPKPHLVQYARETVGTYVIASDDKNFKTADTLGRIAHMPHPGWEDLPLNTTRPYRYYRVCSPPGNPHMNLAEIEFLTNREHGYANTMEATRNYDIPKEENDQWVRLLDEPLAKSRWKREYDGKVTTAPYRWPNVTLQLKEPQWVMRLRYVVRHADNQVVRGHRYRLFRWETNGWVSCWQGVADSNSLKVDLHTGTLYWLRDETDGREEAPFTVTPRGQQVFPHEAVFRRIMPQ